MRRSTVCVVFEKYRVLKFVFAHRECSRCQAIALKMFMAVKSATTITYIVKARSGPKSVMLVAVVYMHDNLRTV